MFTEADRQRALAGFCPYCGKGPYRLLAGHVAHVHGVPRRALKDALGLRWGDPLCDPALSETYRERSKAPEYVESLLANHTSKNGVKPKRGLSEAARQAYRDKLAELRTPEHQERVLELMQRPEAREKAAAKLRVDNPDHGTRLRYRRGCRCDECKAWNASAARDYRSRTEGREVAAKQPSPHGSRRRYEVHGCRCEQCRAGNAARSKRYREKRRAER